MLRCLCGTALVTREHWIANNIYRWMPNVDVIHVNPGFFAVMYLFGLPMIVHFGMLVGPWWRWSQRASLEQGRWQCCRRSAL